jgi:hypothetical protein
MRARYAPGVFIVELVEAVGVDLNVGADVAEVKVLLVLFV